MLGTLRSLTFIIMNADLIITEIEQLEAADGR